MQVQDLKVGQQFLMSGLAQSGEQVKTKCRLIRYNGRALYDLEVAKTGEKVPFSLYKYEVQESGKGGIVRIAEYNDNGSYDAYRNKDLRIVSTAYDKSDHPGYDESMGKYVVESEGILTLVYGTDEVFLVK